MDSLSILIKSILQAPSDAEINKVKLELENKLKNVNINTSGKGIKLLDDKEIDIYVQKMQNQLSRLQIGKGKVFENAGVQEELNKFTQSLELFRNKGAISAKEVGLQFDNLRTRVAQVSGEFKNVNKDGYAFSDMITLAAKKLIIWKVAGDAIFAVIRLLKQIPDIVSKIDESLTEVNKVLDLSTSQMKALAEEATNLGIAYGKTTVEILNSIGSFAKAGLDQETSKQFAQLAALLSNVGDISTEVAEKTLIMANAGYQLGNDYKTLNSLISNFNELANRNAVEVETLADSWQVSASVAKQAKLNIADYNALITVAGSTSQRSGREIGNALRTWLMRLQGVTDGTDTLEEDVSKVDKVLGELGIQLRKTPTEFRPAMDVITEIAAKYRELGEAGETVKQSELLESLAGKYRANIVAGVLSNFDQINKAINDQTNSYMSAEKENERYMNSIQARTKALTAQWELFASKTLDSSVIKSVVELGKVLVQVLDSGFVRFIGTTVLLTATLMGLGIGFKTLTKSTLGTAIGVAALDLAEKGLLATTKALWATLSASPLFWVTAAVLGIQALVGVFDLLNVTVKEQKQKVEETKQVYEETTNKIKELNSELETTKKRINELNTKGTIKLIDEEKKELEHLQLTNKELELRIALLNKEAEIQNKRLADEQTRLYNKQFKDFIFSETQVSEYQENAKLSGNNAILTAEANDISAMIAAYKQFKELKEEALSTGNLDDVNHFDSLLTGIEESLINSSKELQSSKDILSSIIDPTQEQQKILASIENGLNLINSYILPEIVNKTNDIEFPEIDDNIKTYTQSLEEFNKVLDTAQSSVKTLNQVIKNNGKLGADEVMDLVQLYPDLLDKVELTTDGYKIQESALIDLRNQQIATAMASIDSAIKEAEAVKIASEDNIRNYGLQIDTIADLAKAKLELAKAAETEAKKAASKYTDPRDKTRRSVASNDAYNKYLAENGYADLDALEEAIKNIEDLKKKRETYTTLLENLGGDDKSGSKYTPSTKQKALQELLKAEKISLSTYYDELLKLEQSEYKGYANKTVQQLESELRSTSEKVAKKASEYLALKVEQSSIAEQIQKSLTDQISLSFASAENSLKSLDNELSKLGNIDTIEEQAERTEIWQKKLRIVTDEILRIDKVLQNASSLSSAQIQLLENKKTELEILRTSLTDDLADSNKSKLDAIETVEKKIIEIIKKRYEEEAKAREKDYNDEKKELQDSLDAYKDYIQGRIDALDRLHETEDYNKQVNEQTQKIADLQSEIDKYSLAAGSGDMDAQNRVNELLKEQTEERNKLSEMQTDRERDLQKQSLQDQLKNYEKFTKKQEDLLDEEYESYRDNLEKMTSDVALYTEAQKIMANSTFEELTSMYLTFENNFGQGMSLLGDIIENEFISKLEVAKNALSDLNSLTGNKIEKSDNTSLEMAKERIGQLQTLWRETDNEALRLKYNEEAERLRKKYGLSFQDLRGYKGRYLNGGVDTVGGLNWLDGKPNAVETIFNATQGKKLFDFVNNLPNSILNVVKPNIPNFSSLLSGAGSNVNNVFNFNVNGNVDKSTANNIVEQVCREQRIQLNKLGIFKK